MIFDTIQLQPYDGTYPQKALIKIFVDTAADLPALADFTDISPVCGSLAETVDTGDRYRLDSSGTWHMQPAGIFQNVYTKTETDALLAGKQDILTFDTVPTENSTNPVESGGIWSPMADLIDMDRKNVIFVGQTDTTATAAGRNITFIRNADGSVTLNGSNNSTGFLMSYALDIDGASASTESRCTMPAGTYTVKAAPAGARVQVYYTDGSTLSSVVANSDSDKDFTYDRSWPYVVFRLYIKSDAAFNNETFIPFCCKKSFLAVSDRVTPGAPSNAELYEMIKSYHP